MINTLFFLCFFFFLYMSVLWDTRKMSTQSSSIYITCNGEISWARGLRENRSGSAFFRSFFANSNPDPIRSFFLHISDPVPDAWLQIHQGDSGIKPHATLSWTHQRMEAERRKSINQCFFPLPLVFFLSLSFVFKILNSTDPHSFFLSPAVSPNAGPDPDQDIVLIF